MFLLTSNVVEVLDSSGQLVPGIGNSQSLATLRARHTGR